MDTANLAVPKTYISEWNKLKFSNNANLKSDIQNRISNDKGAEFYKALQDMKGDVSTGILFSEITLLAMAYFYAEIFKDKIKNEYYTLEMIKGFLDANNLTPYTAIHEIDVTFYKLTDTPYFKHCWLIIQSAWFFNSRFFGHHTHIEYLNHYINTGKRLPIENYDFDKDYLEKKYSDIDKTKEKKILINGFSLVDQWYNSILFLICRELNLPTRHFKILIDDNREYNPLTKTSRQLRPLTPFKLIECDIKSAFPTFLDIETGANIKESVYENLMLSRGIKRNEAKILFNTICNSGEYKTKSETIRFFLECGYNQKQCEHLIKLTHDQKIKFFSFMTKYECLAINDFKIINNLQRGTRLHDAILLIDDKIKPQIYRLRRNCDFGYNELNQPVIEESFCLSKKRLPYAYINSIPKGLNLISKHDYIKPKVKGEANGFKLYKEAYYYISAGFNINDFRADYGTFILKCDIMISTLQYLNKHVLFVPSHVYLMLNHIRSHSNYVFNVRALYLKLIENQYNVDYVKIKKRDFDLTEHLKFRKNIDFLNAMNEAKKIVNSRSNLYELFSLLEERINNNDYGYLNETIITGHKSNNLIVYAIVRIFNSLCTGLQRQGRKRVKSEPLYSSSIKSLTLKAMSLKPQQQNAFMQKGIKKYERELKGMNLLINNRLIAQQLLVILCDITGLSTDLEIKQNVEVQNQLKTEIMTMIDKTNTQAGTGEFDLLFKKQVSNDIKPNSDLNNVFDGDLSNSIFNHVSTEEAYYKGEVFFNEYLRFHNIVEVKEKNVSVVKRKAINKFPELDF